MSTESVLPAKKERNSNLEMLRIIMMLVIIAHHYVVNSGILPSIEKSINMDITGIKLFNNIFALCIGWGGKMAINVFLLITGYFMCKQKFSYKKVLFLYLEIKFYTFLIYFIFLLTGYEVFSFKRLYKIIFNVAYTFGQGFTTAFLGMYLLVPFINNFIGNVSKKDYQKLIITITILFVFFSTFLLNSYFELISWYIAVYLIGAYIRIYPCESVKKIKYKWGGVAIIFILLSWFSIIVIYLISLQIDMFLPIYWFVNDSNKIFAILPAISLFMYFKNREIKNNKIINKFASATFGVLLIHAHSDTMRQWLWHDVLKNHIALQNSWFLIHMVLSVLFVYLICVFLDFIRQFFAKRIIAFYNRKKVLDVK